MELLRKGSAGRAYLLKERVGDAAVLLRAIREVAGGGSVIDPRVVEALVLSKTTRSPVLAQLTLREMEVLERLAQGLTNAAIAASLFITDRAVEKHISAIFSKLGLTEEADIHRRVKATLVFLSERAAGER